VLLIIVIGVGIYLFISSKPKNDMRTTEQTTEDTKFEEGLFDPALIENLRNQ
jgi:hypothetical protein